MKEKFLAILEDINPEINNETVDLEGIVDSLDIMNIVSSLEEAFDMEFEPEDIIPENFKTVDAIWGLFQKRLSEKQ